MSVASSHSDHMLIAQHYEKPDTRIGLTAFSMTPAAAEACAEFIIRGYRDGTFKGMNYARRALHLAPLIEPYLSPEAKALIVATSDPTAKRSQVVAIENTRVAKFTGPDNPHVVDDMVAALFAIAFPNAILSRPSKPLLRKNEGKVFGEVWHQDLRDREPIPVGSLAGAYSLSRPPTLFCDLECALALLPPHVLERIDLKYTPRDPDAKRREGTITRQELLQFDKFRDRRVVKDFAGLSKVQLQEIAEAWRVAIDQASLEYVVAPGTLVFWNNNGALFHRGVATAPIEKIDADAIVRMVYYTGAVPKGRS